jgi:Tol biopolymer transport system component
MTYAEASFWHVDGRESAAQYMWSAAVSGSRKEDVMKKVSNLGEGGSPTPLFLKTVMTLAGVFVATSLLPGCGPETDRASGEAEAAATAGLVGAPRAQDPGQDSTPTVVRRVWGGPDAHMGADISPDGRHLVFIDGNGALAIRELGTGEIRLLTPEATWYGSYEVAEAASISPDGRQVAYLWNLEDGDPEYELRVVDWEGGEPRVILRDRTLSWFSAGVWSPDGRQILIHAVEPDGNGELSLVSVADGSRRTLKDLGHLWPRNSDFSPDGRFVVYDLPEGENSNERDIYILPVTGGREARVVRHPADDFVLGWAPGGDYIFFASDRTGSLGAWLLPVEGNRPTGDPRLVKADLWRLVAIGFTDEGSYCYGISLAQRDVYVTTIDPVSGEVVSPPTAIDGEDLGSYFRPQWSPDGRYLSFSFQEASVNAWYTDPYYIGIRSVETGETRRLAPGDLRVFGTVRWFPDGHHLLVSGPMDNQEGRFKVDVQTGEADPLEPFRGRAFGFLGFSPDGRSLIYGKRETDGRVIARMDLEEGVETILSREPGAEPPNRASLSRDAQHVAFVWIDEAGFRIVTMPVDGGELRELLSIPPAQAPEGLWSIVWSPDGRHLYYMTLYQNTPHQLWRLPTAGGAPQEILELDPALNIPVGLSFHPDGRRLAFDAQRSGAEVWLMENFLPSGDGGG